MRSPVERPAAASALGPPPGDGAGGRLTSAITSSVVRNAAITAVSLRGLSLGSAMGGK